MPDARDYVIQIGNCVDQDELNATSPLRVSAEPADAGATRLAVRTDQSGLIGLLRYLHGLGLELLSVAVGGEHTTSQE